MRIKVHYDPYLKRLEIPIVIKIPQRRIKTKIIFDTGNPKTFLNYTDSRRLCIPYIKKSEIIGIGGEKLQGYSFDRITFIFKSEENELISEPMNVRFVRPNVMDPRSINKLDDIPNLLGMDFLERGYKFICDLKSKEIYFEKV